MQAEEAARRVAETATKRAERAERLAEIEAHKQAGRKMVSPPVKPSLSEYGCSGRVILLDEPDSPGRVAWRAYRLADYQYRLAHEGDEETDDEVARILEEEERETAREKANADYLDYLAKLGNREPKPSKATGYLEGDTYGLYIKAHDAWEQAHPEILARREAKQEAELQKFLDANPEERAEHERAEKEKAELEAKIKAKEAKRIKREAKDPAAALERARDAAQREAMADEKDEAKRDARENGDAWSDVKEEWEADWLASNWMPEEEADFLVTFWNQWQKDHGAPFHTEDKAA